VLRIFVALWPTIVVGESLAAAAERSITSREAREVRATRPHRIHLTLAFLGDLDGKQVEKLADELERVAALESAQRLVLDHAGHFSDHVLWVGPREPVDGLKSLAKSTRKAVRSAGLTVQGSDFRPHITVARTRGDAILTTAVDELTALLQDDPVSWYADDMCLVSSVRGPGATYDVLERWQLPAGS